MIGISLENYEAIIDIFTRVQTELQSFIFEVILFRKFMRIEQQLL